MVLRRPWNLTNLFVLIGLATIAGGSWYMHRQAGHISTIEGRVATLMDRWKVVLRDTGRVDLSADNAADELLRRFTDLPDRPALSGPPLIKAQTPDHLRGRAVYYQTSHYYFMVCRVPEEHPYTIGILGQKRAATADYPKMDPARAAAWRWPWVDRDNERVPTDLALLEAYAWPRSDDGDATFFVPGHGPVAFHRNLDDAYRGHRISRSPAPGCARMAGRPQIRRGLLQSYRGYDDRLWIKPASDAF